MEAGFSGPFLTGLETHPASYTVDTGSFTGVKRPVCGVDHPAPYLAQRLKKEYSNTSTASPGFVACSRVNFTVLDLFRL